jgi:uncharacterized integral membrane protein (TIGR00697 family)
MEYKRNSKYLLALAMFYMTIKITTVLLIYKIITIGSFSPSASTIIIPLWFVTGDIIAEIYGYKTARNLIWMAILGQFIFAFLCWSFALVDSPDILQNQEAYEEILTRIPRVAFASFLAIALGGILNAYAINKWKILLHGKYFLLRSFGASAIGELTFTICAYMVKFAGITPISKIIELITISYIFKLIINPFLIIPAFVITKYIKSHETSLSNVNLDKENLFNSLLNNTSKNTKIIELFAGQDNKSYFKEIIIKPSIKHPLGLYSEKFKVSNMIFREFQPDMEFNWHNAPQEQYIIYLEGEVLVKSSGGESKIFKSGDILLAKDLKGQGHITKTLTYGRSIVITTE